MPKRKRHTKLPNGYGNITFLGKGRRRPYAVYPPSTKRIQGRQIRASALGYCETYEDARELLSMYHKGLDLPDVPIVKKTGPTFAEVYERYYADKYSNEARQLSEASRRSTQSAYKNVTALHDRDFCSLTYADLQAVLDSCQLKHASLELIKSLFRQMYAYAEKYEITDKDQSRHLEIRIPDDDEHGVPFSDEDIARIWADVSQDASGTAKRLLVMIYSGFRVSAFSGLLVRLEPEWYFQGGVKTKAGKNRIVPIHSGIRQIVAELMESGGLGIKPATFNRAMRQYLPTIGIMDDHTPHDCRHTFSRLCEKYGVPEADRKRLMGHSFGADITNGIYGHRTLEELRESIELIQIKEVPDASSR